VGIIPARLSSTRLPEKALQDLCGAPLVVRVLERARASAVFRDVIVATDSDRIAEAIRSAGGRPLRTRSDHETGLDRVAEAARALEASGELGPRDVVVDLQGDEPFASLEGIEAMTALFRDPGVRMTTLAVPFPPDGDPADPNRVKAVVDRSGRALYFSRAPVPHGAPKAGGGAPLLHIGLYAFRPETLQSLAGLEPCALERAERLEQLRALWYGIQIHVAVGDYHSHGIDTQEDLEQARRIWRERRDAG
jgi:3-deoxy-manno-octulosonate cytidylyltransferase (CMP-KDO synthetase)